MIGGTGTTILLDLSNDTSVSTTGPVTIELFASLTTSVAADAVRLLPAVTRHLTLKPGNSASMRLKYAIPATMPQGSYYIVAEITRFGATTAVASANPVNVIPAIIDLAPAFPQHLPTPLAPGGTGSVLVTVVNNGNTPARGSISLALSITSSAGGAPLAVATSAARVKLKPGKSKTIRIRYRLPLTLGAGSYQFSATIQDTTGFRLTGVSNITALDPTPFTLE